MKNSRYFSLLVLLVLMAFSLTPVSGATILHGPVVNPANGHTYYLLSTSDWNEAQLSAAALGGTLVTINDPDENDWVFTTFAKFGDQPRTLWIGLTDMDSEGVFVWVSGEESAYRNWAPGEPNDGAGG